MTREVHAVISMCGGPEQQVAAQRLAVQIADFAKRQRSLVRPEELVELNFDEGILDDELRYLRYLHTLAPSPVASASVATGDPPKVQRVPRFKFGVERNARKGIR
jgi:hypothetical protein